MVLTWAGLDTGGSEAEPLVRVRLGLEGVRVIDGGRGAALPARATVVKVTACLQGRRETGGGFTLALKHSTSGWCECSCVQMQVCVCLLTKQSVSLGPVQPAAHCVWQQSLGLSPLHRGQSDAQFT